MWHNTIFLTFYSEKSHHSHHHRRPKTLFDRLLLFTKNTDFISKTFTGKNYFIINFYVFEIKPLRIIPTRKLWLFRIKASNKQHQAQVQKIKEEMFLNVISSTVFHSLCLFPFFSFFFDNLRGIVIQYTKQPPLINHCPKINIFLLSFVVAVVVAFIHFHFEKFTDCVWKIKGRKEKKEEMKEKKEEEKKYICCQKQRNWGDCLRPLSNWDEWWWFLCVDIQRAHLMEIVCNMLLRIWSCCLLSFRLNPDDVVCIGYIIIYIEYWSRLKVFWYSVAFESIIWVGFSSRSKHIKHIFYSFFKIFVCFVFVKSCVDLKKFSIKICFRLLRSLFVVFF